MAPVTKGKWVAGSREAKFGLELRTNVHTPKRKEWALNCTIGTNKWTVITWSKLPKTSEVERMVDFAQRCFELYHKSLTFPPFNTDCALDRMGWDSIDNRRFDIGET